jgi:hypothetical protein
MTEYAFFFLFCLIENVMGSICRGYYKDAYQKVNLFLDVEKLSLG